jgi:hypothetical protein
MKKPSQTNDSGVLDSKMNRRTFFKSTALAGAAVVIPAALADRHRDHDRDRDHDDARDTAILRFLAAAELLETDLWQQYTELANGNPAFNAALSVIDGDMAPYITQNTVDELSHATFLNAYLASKHRPTVNLDAFRTLPSSTATGAAHTKRLTNLMHLNVDTSWYTRYRSSGNPDFGDTFPQIVTINNRPGIPLHNNYTTNQMQAIANTAAFHFAMIEQGGSSLYDTLSFEVSDAEVLRIVTSIGGTEVAHFEIWNDKAGDTPAVNSGDGLVFPDLGSNTQFISNQVMPKPCKFIDKHLPLCSIIRPTLLELAGAQAAVKFLTSTGLFIGQSQAFFRTLQTLAEEADGVKRGP